MLYLSKISVSCENSLPNNVVDVHKLIKSVLPNPSKRELFRIEPINPKSFSKDIIVQTQDRPAWEKLNSPDIQVKSKSISPVFDKGQVFKFRLRGNPTKDENGIRRIRRALLTKDEQLTWISRKATENGFSIKEAQVSNEPLIKAQHKEQCLIIKPALFEGTLEITDVKLFNNAFLNGIGHSKAFGCGLLSLAVK